MDSIDVAVGGGPAVEEGAAPPSPPSAKRATSTAAAAARVTEAEVPPSSSPPPRRHGHPPSPSHGTTHARGLSWRRGTRLDPPEVIQGELDAAAARGDSGDGSGSDHGSEALVGGGGGGSACDGGVAGAEPLPSHGSGGSGGGGGGGRGPPAGEDSGARESDSPDKQLSRARVLLTVIQFFPDGRREQLLMTRAEVRALVRDTLREVPTAAQRQRQEGADPASPAASRRSPRSGRERSVSVSGTSGVVGWQGPRHLHSRDLRLLNPQLDDVQPSIMARVGATIVHLQPIRAVLLHNKCLVFLNEGADQELEVLLDHLEASGSSTAAAAALAAAGSGGGGGGGGGGDHDSGGVFAVDSSTAFEIRALEAILETVFSDITRRLEALQRRLPRILEKVISSPTPRVLQQLRKAKNDTDLLESHASALKGVIKSLLDDDEDMALMQLTELQRRGADAVDDLAAFNVEEVELLLEAYLQVAHGAVRRLKDFDRQIDNTEELVEIQLDTTRNRILTLGFALNVVTCVVSFCTLLAGIFGMNLESGEEGSTLAFKWVTGSTVTAALCVPLAVIYLLQHYAVVNLKV